MLLTSAKFAKRGMYMRVTTVMQLVRAIGKAIVQGILQFMSVCVCNYWHDTIVVIVFGLPHS